MINAAKRVLTALSAAAALGVMTAGAALSQPLVIEGVTLIDGTGAPPATNMTVVIENGRFARVVPAALAAQAAGSGGTRIDGRGKYLIPGLMDMHIHLRGRTEITTDGIRRATGTRDVGVAALQSYIYAGVTSVYDAGNDPDYIFGLRDDERAGRLISPRIFATGGIATRTGSHGSGNGSTALDSWAEARAGLDAHLARRPDVLKLTLEERGWGARPLIPLLDLDLMQRVIEYANDRGIRTVVHASSELRARESIFAGVDALAHPVIQGPVSDSFVQLMGAKRVPVVTTLTIGENYSRLVDDPGYLDQPLYRASLSKADIELLKTRRRSEWAASTWTFWMKLMTPVAQENLRKLHAGGATLVAGTDQTSGPALHRELELLAAAGIPALDIIKMATLNGAIFLGLERELGSIEPGKKADAVLLSADPAADIRNAREIAMVIKDGVILDESKLALAGGPVPRRKP